MAETFIPFFERGEAGGNFPTYQFTHYGAAKDPLPEDEPQPPAPAEASLPHYKLSKIKVAHVHPSKHAERSGLRAKLLNDLKNAVNLSLPEDEIAQMLASVQQVPQTHGEFDEPAEAPVEGTSGESDDSESPRAAPQISLERDGDRITQIVVECVCGEVIALDCIY